MRLRRDFLGRLKNKSSQELGVLTLLEINGKYRKNIVLFSYFREEDTEAWWVYWHFLPAP